MWLTSAAPCGQTAGPHSLVTAPGGETGCAAFPGLGPEQAAACVAELDEAGGQVPGTLTQNPGSYITPALRHYGLGNGPDQVAAAQSAMCLPAASRLRLFPGAAGLLASINDP